MSRRFVDARWIRQRMDAKDARVQAAQRRRDAAHLAQTETAIAAFRRRTRSTAQVEADAARERAKPTGGDQ